MKFQQNKVEKFTIELTTGDLVDLLKLRFEELVNSPGGTMVFSVDGIVNDGEHERLSKIVVNVTKEEMKKR